MIISVPALVVPNYDLQKSFTFITGPKVNGM